MPSLPSGEWCGLGPRAPRPRCNASQLSLESETHNRRPDCSYDHQELCEFQFPTSRFQTPKGSKMEEKNPNDKKEKATALQKPKLELRFSHLPKCSERTKRRSVTDVTRRQLLSTALALKIPCQGLLDCSDPFDGSVCARPGNFSAFRCLPMFTKGVSIRSILTLKTKYLLNGLDCTEKTSLINGPVPRSSAARA